MMTNGDPEGQIFYPTLTRIMDSFLAHHCFFFTFLFIYLFDHILICIRACVSSLTDHMCDIFIVSKFVFYTCIILCIENSSFWRK